VKVLFCGVGALGSHAAVLCRNLPITLGAVDFDRVESRNLLAQAYVRQSVGKRKAKALAAQLKNFHGVTLTPFPVRLSDANARSLCAGWDLLVDCFDNAASRALLSQTAQDLGIPLVHAGISADGSVGIVRWDARFVPDTEDTPGQATCEGGDHLPLIGALSASLARVIQDHVERGVTRDVLVTLEGTQTTFREQSAAPSG
jgi:hypothetical protein